MNEHASIHELLPWYVAGTLDSSEERAFRDHLASCPECREEMKELERLRAAADEHGAALFSEHPEAERLVAAVRGQAPEEEAAEIRRHLAVCSTCAAEWKWIAGEAVARSRGPVAAPRARFASWALACTAVAAAVLATVVLIAYGNRDRPYWGVDEFHTLASGERSEAAVRRIPRPSGGRPLHLVLEADLDAAAFPVNVEITGPGGGEAYRDVVRRSELSEGLYVSLLLDPARFPPGTYLARLVPADERSVPVEFRFEIVEALPRRSD